MVETVSVRLGNEIQKDLVKVERKWQIDRSEVIRRLLVEAIKGWKIENALKEISEHRMSIGKAAEECKISIWEMLDFVKRKNVDWTGYSDDDLKRDLATLA